MRWQRSHMDDWFCRTVAGFPHSHSGLEFLGDALTFLLFFINGYFLEGFLRKGDPDLRGLFFTFGTFSLLDLERDFVWLIP